MLSYAFLQKNENYLIISNTCNFWHRDLDDYFGFFCFPMSIINNNTETDANTNSSNTKNSNTSSFKFSCFYYLQFLNKFINLLISFYTKEKTQNIQKLHSCYIDINQNPILVFKTDNRKESVSTREEVVFFSQQCNKYKIIFKLFYPKFYTDFNNLIKDISLIKKEKSLYILESLQLIQQFISSQIEPLAFNQELDNFFITIFKIDQYHIEMDNSEIECLLKLFIHFCSSFADLKKVKNIIPISSNTKKYHYISIFSALLKKILDQHIFIKEYEKMLNHSPNDIKPRCIFDMPNTLYRISFDNKMLFYLEKTYNNNVNEKIIDREKYILSQEYSKFIVHYAINGKNKSNKLIIPYFPIGNLDSLLFPQQSSTNSEYQLKLNMIDKIVMIYEVATALNDLHSNDEYHGNLSSQSIYINSSKDAYLGSFCYDRSLETDSTKPRGPFYYRAPENIKSNNNDDKNEHKEEEETEDYINKQQKNDIYSFGVLLHEILTEISSESRFGNSSRQKRLEILKCECNDESKKRKEDDKEKKDENTEIQEKYTDNFKNYSDFLFKEGGGNEVFEDNYKDEEGNSFKGMKEIIEKCMKTDINERYSSFKELIGCIEALPIYIKNKEEIEFRIKHAIDAREYQCTISDLVESYYRGQTASKTVIEYFQSIYKHIPKYVDTNNIVIERIDDFIIKSFYDLFNADQTDENILKSFWYEFFSYNISMTDYLKKIISAYKNIARPTLIDEIKDDFINFYVQKNKDMKNYANANGRFDQVLLDIKANSKFYWSDIFADIFFAKLFSESRMDSNFKKISNDTISSFGQIGSLNEISGSTVEINNEFHFFFFKIPRNLNFCKTKSKFIINATQKELYCEIPYFPFMTLDTFLFEKKMKVNFSIADKIVIILEIASALKDLHDINNNEYLGNLCRQLVFINSRKDAYLLSIHVDRNNVNDNTSHGECYYHQAPELIQDSPQLTLLNENQTDIYSFGILINEIFTGISVESRFGNMPFNDRKSIIKGEKGTNLFQLLYPDNSNNNAENNDEIKSVVQRCIDINPKKRYNSFADIISDIKNWKIYDDHKAQIEFRLENAIEAKDYHCKISNIVESFYRGKTDLENLVKKFINLVKYPKIASDNSTPCNGDLAASLTEITGNNIGEDYSQHFEDIFNLVINQFYHRKLSRNQSVVDEEDYLLKLSREANLDEEEEREIIIPVCSLGSFIENNGNRIEEGDSLTFLYFIAKDLSFIHSNNLYHGEVTADHIGLYYNHETRTLIPSVILYYSYYKNNQNSMNDMNSKKRIPSKMYSSEELVSKEQRKDIKNFKNIAEKLGIPPTILSIIQESETMNEIVNHLSNFIRNNSNKKQLEIFKRNYSSCSYSSFVITYPIIEEVFHHIEDNDYSFEGLAIDFENIYQMMNGLLDNIESHPENSIKANLPPFITSTNTTQTVDKITNLIENIKSKCKILYTETNGNNPKEESSLIIDMDMNSVTIRQVKDNNSPEKSIDKQEVQEIVLTDYTGPKKKIYQTKIDKLPSKEVFRYIEFAGLYKRSVGFLLKRYIFNLNPKFRYRITIKLNNQKYLDTQDESITLNEIKRITSQIDRMRKEPEAQDGNIVVLINAETDKSSDNQQNQSPQKKQGETQNSTQKPPDQESSNNNK